MSTPIVEFTNVFSRTLGDTSDVVSKEMYSFEDRNGEGVTLRPECTAGVVRAFLSNGLMQHVPLKLFTTGPVFRYERPQKGRQRQFHQVNYEIIGEASPLADAELIGTAQLLLKTLGIEDKITLDINSLGDCDTRLAYRNALIDYLTPYANDLSDDSKRRLSVNPMRILDSKDENDKKITADAPHMAEFYSDGAKQFFDQLQAYLTQMGLSYRINPRLVRGLDYYCHTAFEFVTDHLGAQNAVLAGGRYDGLIEMMGGKPTPAVGFAGGVERLIALCEQTPDTPSHSTLIPIGPEAEAMLPELSYALRAAGKAVNFAYQGNLRKRMKKAHQSGASFAIIFGEDEIKAGRFILKDFTTSNERSVTKEELFSCL